MVKKMFLIIVLFIHNCIVMAQEDTIQYKPGMFETERYLYAAQKDGLYKLEKTMAAIPVRWKLVGFADVPLCHVVVKGDSIIATTALEGPDSLLLFSSDGGKSFVDCTPVDLWHQNRIEEKKPILPYSMTVSPDNDNVLVINVHNSGIYKSVDFGKTWSLLSGMIPGTFVAYNPNESKQLFFCYEVMTMSGVIGMSPDDGMTSMQVFSPSVAWIDGLVFHPTNKLKMVAYGPGVLAKSENKGYTWTNIIDKLKQDFGYVIFRAAVYGVNGIYAAECDDNKINIFYSNDEGVNWTMLNSVHPQTELGAVGSLHIIDHILYINTTNAGVLTFDVGEATNNLISISDDTFTPYYDLQGRKVTHPTRGIYIKDGRKVAIK